MDYIIEDGYNTNYITTILLALFCEKSMIERCLLLENNSSNLNGLYLQKLIQYNFVNNIQNNICVKSDILNEIRLCAMTLGWKDNKIDIACSEYDPLDFMQFILNTINFHPIEIDDIQNNILDFINLNPNIENVDIQHTYFDWTTKNKISNIPIFILFKLDQLSSNIKINKKIKLFNGNHPYHNIRWLFHSLFYEDNGNYVVIINKNDKLLISDRTKYPMLTYLNISTLNNLKGKNIRIFYKKDPSTGI